MTTAIAGAFDFLGGGATSLAIFFFLFVLDRRQHSIRQTCLLPFLRLSLCVVDGVVCKA